MPTHLQDLPIYNVLRDLRAIPLLLQDTNLTGLFLDFDLSILGVSSVDDYRDRYSSLITREYGHLDSNEFRIGRVTIMRRFLDRERIYFTDYFHNKYEANARRNIMWEIEMLTNTNNLG